jgi:hypothetical protein
MIESIRGYGSFISQHSAVTSLQSSSVLASGLHSNPKRPLHPDATVAFIRVDTADQNHWNGMEAE